MVEIPLSFFEVPYEPQQYPGVANGLTEGANCQHFCYEILRHFGFEMGPLRSSDLWEDTFYTTQVREPQALDLILFNRTQEAYGAHVGIYLDQKNILHLSLKNGKPVIWEKEQFLVLEEYQNVIGLKRPTKKGEK